MTDPDAKEKRKKRRKSPKYTPEIHQTARRKTKAGEEKNTTDSKVEGERKEEKKKGGMGGKDPSTTFERAENRAQHLGVLLAQVLVEHNAQVTHQLLLFARAHDHRNARHQIGGLLTHARGFVVEAPLR